MEAASRIAREMIQETTTGLGVIDYERLAERLAGRDAVQRVWQEVAHLLGERGEAEAWERFLGLTYPMEAPTVLPDRSED